MARIPDLLAQGRTFSFEFMPPKSEEMMRELEKTLQELEPLKPSFCSVTYGAGGSTRERTLDAVLHVHRDTPMVAMPHLTCVGQTRHDIAALLERYRDEGIENLLALAGDPPLEGPAVGDFTYAVELIELARSLGDFAFGVAAFPEVHPRSPDRTSDRARLAEKLQVADFCITQFFWDADHYFRLVDEMDRLGVTTPIIPSVFPFVNVAMTKRFTTVNGAELPAWLADALDAVDGDPDAVRALGIDVATTLATKLLEAGVPGLHVYTMNRSHSVRRLYENLGLPA